MIGTFLFSVFFGFLSASIIHPIFHKTLRFRAEWGGTFVACMMTSLVCGITFATAMVSYDRKGDFFIVLVLGTTIITSFVAGLLSFRLIIRSESGRSLNLLTSGIASALLVTPPSVIGIVAHLLSDSH